MANEETKIELRKIGRELAVYSLIGGGLWILLYAAWATFPYIRNGTDVIVNAKIDEIKQGVLFTDVPKQSPRVVVLGDSRILSGFVPSQFDRLSGNQISSYNAGLPGHSDFVDNLDLIVSHGNAPTFVFLLLPIPPVPTEWEPDGTPKRVLWPPPPFEPTPFRWFASDERILDRLFPFRELPRDLATFAILSRGRGGFVPFYEQARRFAKQVVADRGFFFIESQQLYPDGRLPSEFALSTDTQSRPFQPQQLDVTSPEFTRLVQIVREHSLRLIFIPGYVREKGFAPSPAIDAKMVADLKPYPEFQVIGPDYFSYANQLFSDAVHVNPEGAVRYTEDLWNATRSVFADAAPKERRP